MLLINNISVVYSDVIQVLMGVSMTIKRGEVISLIGSNGAGKTTLLKGISGLLKVDNGRVTEGSIEYEGDPIHNSSPEYLTSLGIIQVLEGRQDFKHLTVEESLKVGTSLHWGRPFRKDLEMVYDYFPALLARKKSKSMDCSVGELQMLAIGRAMMARPGLMLLDEPSLGLAPLLVKEIFQIIGRINWELGTTLLLVEQNANMALQIAHYGYVLENGRILFGSKASDLPKNPDGKEFFLGTTRSVKEKVNTFRRCRRWLM